MTEKDRESLKKTWKAEQESNEMETFLQKGKISNANN